MKPVEIALFTDSVTPLVDFYGALLGRPPARQSRGMAVFDVGEMHVLIHERSQPQQGQPPCENHIAFGAADIDAACEELVAQRLVLLIPPTDFDWGRSAYLRDPDGRLVEVQSLDTGVS